MLAESSDRCMLLFSGRQHKGMSGTCSIFTHSKVHRTLPNSVILGSMVEFLTIACPVLVVLVYALTEWSSTERNALSTLIFTV